MGTTAIFAEILIIGLEALVWIVLALLAWFGGDKVDLVPLASNEALVLLVVVASAYVLGVLVDRLADSTLLWLDPRIDCRLKRWRSNRLEHVNAMRLRLMAPDLGVAPFLEYQRSRVRVARGTVFNLFLTVVAANMYLLLRGPSDPTERATAFVLGNAIGIVLLLITYDVFRKILRASFKNLDRAYQLLVVEAGGEPQGETEEIVAGVVHRTSGNELEFLLVRTKDGCHWTFPKGHVKRREDRLRAVAREVLEEAGVRGTVRPEPLITYRYPPTRDDELDDSTVTAFLFSFAKQSDAAEQRGAGWFGAAEAKARLRKGREHPHAGEAEAVIDAAVVAIGNQERAG
jgi:bis(5'-nucleosidyl)-tetraphosphatase